MQHTGIRIDAGLPLPSPTACVAGTLRIVWVDEAFPDPRQRGKPCRAAWLSTSGESEPWQDSQHAAGVGLLDVQTQI